MARFTFVRQDALLTSDVKDDTLAAGTVLETGAVNSEDDLNGLRSQMKRALDLPDWFTALTAPTALEAGVIRGVQTLNEGLHAIEKKRAMRGVDSIVDITVTAAQNWEILGTGELPPNTTAAVGAVTTLGTIVSAHGGTFGTHSLTEVAGSTALNPKNLVEVFDGTTRDPITDAGGERIWGLLQTETATDGHTITTATTTRAQISFVVINGTGDNLVAVAVADIAGKTINVRWPERVRVEDLTEQDFLRGAIADVPSGATVTRQVAYDNQGVTPVDLVTNATLDLEGPGLIWSIRDDLQADIFRVVEGSAGGTSIVHVTADADTFDVDAINNDFANGASFGTAGTPIGVAETAGEITRAADIILRSSGAGEILFSDANRAGSTFAVDLKLADTSQEWSDYETAFGEVSILNALVQASNVTPGIEKTTAVVTANTAADIDVGGTAGGANLDAQIHNLSGGDFVKDHDVYLDGQLLRGGPLPTSNFDYYPGTSLALGQLKFEFNLKASPGNPSVLTVLSRA